MSTWRERKYGGQGNRARRDAPTPRNHAEDGWCYCDLLGQALTAGTITTITTVTGPDGTPQPITDRETARKAKNRAYTCGQVAGVSLVMREDGLGLVELGDGAWGFRFRPEHPHIARAHIDGKISRGEELAYQHAQGDKRRDKRRQTKTEQRQREEADARRRHYTEALATAPIGGDGNYQIWALDHGHRPPASPAEQQRKDAVMASQAKAQQEAAKQAAAQQARKPTALDLASDLISKWMR